MKTVLAPLTGDSGDNAALETAYLIARLFEGHITGLHVSPGWAELVTRSGLQDMESALPSAEVFAALEQEQKSSAWRAHRHFAELCRRWQITPAESHTGSQAVSAEMREIRGDAQNETISEARFHDLVVLGRTADARGFGAMVIGSGRPVLIAPRQAPENLAPTIAVAWKETPEAARALTAAMPLLKKADKIVVLSAEEGKGRAATEASAGRIARHLHWHGLSTENDYVDTRGRTVSDALVQSSRAHKADLLIMGGYGHSRMRELVLGGVTRDLLTDCPLPLFLFH
jgi:nucleotide-binding universal stress UspA family protein